MRRRILVSGGAGFIGTALVGAFHADDQVLIVDNFHPQVHHGSWELPPSAASVEVLAGDVTSVADMRAAADFRPDHVIHLAAETGTGQSLTESRRHGLVNVVGTNTLLDAMAEIGHVPSQLLLTSSRAVYGEGQWRSPDGSTFAGRSRVPEDLVAGRWLPRSPSGGFGEPLPHRADLVPSAPTNIYAATKLAQENVMRPWAAAYGSALTVLRLQNVYGAGQSVHNSYTGVLTLFARQALSGAVIDVYEGGGIVRDFVHVRDVVQAVMRALDTSGDHVLDIGSGRAVTLLETAEQIAALAAAPTPRTSDNFRPGDVRAAWADIDVAQRVLGYSPQIDSTEGLKNLLDWVETQ